MVNTIGNPLTWGVRRAAAAGTHLVHVGENVAGADAEPHARLDMVERRQSGRPLEFVARLHRRLARPEEE